MSAAKRHDLCGADTLLVCIQIVVRCSSLQNVKDRRLKSFLEGSDAQALHAARKAARSELLLQEEPGYVHVDGVVWVIVYKLSLPDRRKLFM